MSTHEKVLRHGIDCEKVPHARTGYMHGDADDSPYLVDGVWGCERCHGFLTSAQVAAALAAVRAAETPAPEPQPGSAHEEAQAWLGTRPDPAVDWSHSLRLGLIPRMVAEHDALRRRLDEVREETWEARALYVAACKERDEALKRLRVVGDDLSAAQRERDAYGEENDSRYDMLVDEQGRANRYAGRIVQLRKERDEAKHKAEQYDSVVKSLGVCDGGQYREDVISAIDKLRRERDEAKGKAL